MPSARSDAADSLGTSRTGRLQRRLLGLLVSSEAFQSRVQLWLDPMVRLGSYPAAIDPRPAGTADMDGSSIHS